MNGQPCTSSDDVLLACAQLESRPTATTVELELVSGGSVELAMLAEAKAKL